MSEASRTPGPWISRLPLGLESMANGRYVIVRPASGAEPEICILRQLDAAINESERLRKEADARFIVTAANSHDELVKALEFAARIIDDFGHGREVVSARILAVTQQIDAALARARATGKKEN